MENDVTELVQRVTDFILANSNKCWDIEDCSAVLCTYCPAKEENASIVARGFVKELINEHGTEVFQEVSI